MLIDTFGTLRCVKTLENLVFVTAPFLFPICLKSPGLLP